MRTRRGSVMVFVLMMVFAVTLLILVASTLGLANVQSQRQYEDEYLADAAFDGALAQLDADNSSAALTLPYTRAISINGWTGNATVTDYTATLSGTLKVTATLTGPNGRVRSRVGYIPESKKHLWKYAFAVNATVSGGQRIITGASGVSGDVYCNGDYTPAGASVVNGNAYVTGSTISPTVTGTSYTAYTPITFPTISALDYLTNATTTYLSNQNITNYTFPTVPAGSPYPIVYFSGNLSLSGTISGIGTFFVNGTLDLHQDVSYADSNSKLAIISPRNFTLDFDCVGYYFCSAQITLNNGTVPSGGLVSNTIKSSKPCTLILDPTIKNSASEGVKMHLPGLWP